MRTPLAVARFLLLAAAVALASPAFAREDPGENVEAKLINAQLQNELRAANTRPGVTGGNDTVYVGFKPGAVSSVNYWGLGTGSFNPYSTSPEDYGYWGWDDDAANDNIAEVHGDSLFGWWPVRVLMNGTGGQTRADENRPWWAVDIGNNANYVINQGAGLKRTYGVIGVWHPDAGATAGSGVTWSALGGARSMWAGLRRHGDTSHSDPITGNAFNADLVSHVIQGGSLSGGPLGSDARFPGYANQWDQMAYRDIDVTGASTITVRFKFRSNLSTGRVTATATRTGWFDKDPLAVTFNQSGNGNALGNFISSSYAADPPIDSFMVYVGAPTVDSLGAVPVSGGDWFLASDGVVRRVYDPQRRWFSEVLRANESGKHREIFTTYGNRPAQTVEIAGISLNGASANGRTRLVFRSKTNRGFADEDSFLSGWNGGGAGGAVFDDVEITLDGGPSISIGDFEDAGDVDNDPATTALDAWKTTGKPPAMFHHVHDISTLQYDDLCGEVDGPRRNCNLRGNVVSMGDHDNAEAAGGLTEGTADHEIFEGMISPTINLRNGGGTNAIGINAEIADVTDYYIDYDIYTGIFDLFTTGNCWRGGDAAYPARQVDGTAIWSGWRLWPFIIFNPDPQCFQDQEPAYAYGLLRWDPALSESGDYPDSLRVMLHRRNECYRFGVTSSCAPTDGAYWDNVSVAFVDEAAPPMSVNIWDWINDTFTVNGMERDNNPLGGAEFDTTTALVKIGLNIAQSTNSTARYAIPGDSTALFASGNEVRIDLVFRISPGPGNYRTLGVRSSGLRGVPTSTAGIDFNSPGNNFWANYLADGGPAGGSGNQHTANNVFGTNGGRDWSALAWNSARCDSAEQNFWRLEARGLGGPIDGAFATIYSELDPKYATLGIAKNRCWLITATAPVTSANTACGNPSAVTDGWPVAAGYVDEDGGGPLALGQTYEYTKILPDGQFTPGTHVQYFFRHQDLATAEPASLAPDTNRVSPQSSEGSTDGHRWQQFSILPDRWKRGAYGGLGAACMLFVDNNDRRGDERAWVSTADSICGATQANKYGAHNGWHATGNGADINDPAGFVRNLNQQPGTTWDMYGVKASESLTTRANGIGVDFSNHSPVGLINGQWSFCGPSIDMLEEFYSVILLLSGDLNSGVLGPYVNNGSDDHAMLEQFLAGGQTGEANHRGLWAMGDGFVESEYGLPLLDEYLKVTLRSPSYLLETNVDDDCIDLVTQTPITTNGDIYGIRNSCLWTLDVLDPVVDFSASIPSTVYAPTGSGVAPLVAGVFHDIDEVRGEYWQSLVDGFDIEYLRSRFCESTTGRRVYFYNALTNIFGKICAVTGSICITSDVPQNPSGVDFVDFMNLRNNPLITGRATVDFGLARKDRVTVSVYDVSGRLVRELADREFTPGNYSLTWDGVDDDGRQVPRGVYFTQVKYRNGGFTSARKVTVLK